MTTTTVVDTISEVGLMLVLRSVSSVPSLVAQLSQGRVESEVFSEEEQLLRLLAE